MKYFKISEFDQPGLPGSGDNMRIGTLTKLEATREAYKKPMRISSGYRSPEHNAKVGGAKKSAHMEGRAADVADIADAELVDFLEAAYSAGFRRFGIMNTAVHVDDQPGRGEAMWHYQNDKTQRWKTAWSWWKEKNGL